ncbi:MAG: type I phosphomannose isomerase catalytic subunit [Chlamydiota bacterium]
MNQQVPSFYPLLLQPAYQHYLWGGRRILDMFHRPDQQKIVAESWELSDRPEGDVLIENGVYREMRLSELQRQLQSELIGRPASCLPLLIKLIDATLDLSIQVHPNEKTAPTLQGEPKTEVWIVLDAEPGAFVYAGLKKKASLAELRQAIQREQLPQLLHRIAVKAGDVIFIPAGTIHAIGAGCFILEVQQNSNTTYRVFDYGRRDAEGNMRTLHLEEALVATDLHHFSGALQQPRLKREDKAVKWEELIACPYFCVDRLHVYEEIDCARAEQSFTYYFVLKGRGKIKTDTQDYDLAFGRSYLLPYGLKKWHLQSEQDLVLMTAYLHPINSHS